MNRAVWGGEVRRVEEDENEVRHEEGARRSEGARHDDAYHDLLSFHEGQTDWGNVQGVLVGWGGSCFGVGVVVLCSILECEEERWVLDGHPIVEEKDERRQAVRMEQNNFGVDVGDRA